MDDKEGTKQALKFLILSPSYQGVKRLFAISLEDEAGWKGDIKYYLPTVEIKDRNTMIYGRNVNTY